MKSNDFIKLYVYCKSSDSSSKIPIYYDYDTIDFAIFFRLKETYGWLIHKKKEKMASSRNPVSLSTLAAKNTICCIYQLLMKEDDGRDDWIQVLFDSMQYSSTYNYLQYFKLCPNL